MSETDTINNDKKSLNLRKATLQQLYYLARYTEYHLNAISELARRELVALHGE